MSPELELHTMLEHVKDRASFLAFIDALIADRRNSAAQERVNPSSPYSPDAGGWENSTIESFFGAALAWASDIDQMPEEPSWQAFATFLYLGKTYE